LLFPTSLFPSLQAVWRLPLRGICTTNLQLN